MKEVLEENYGGEPLNGFGNDRPQIRTYKRFTNAYMLVYIRESMQDKILGDVTDQDIPEHLAHRLEEERLARERRIKEQSEQHLYMKLYTVTDKSFEMNTSFDFVDLENHNLFDESVVRSLRVRLDMTYGEFLDLISKQFEIPRGQFRPWLLVNRQNRTVRPDTPIPESERELNMTMKELSEKYLNDQQPLRLYIESAASPENGAVVFPEPPPNTMDILVFIKLFDPKTQQIRGIGKVYVKKQGKVGAIVEQLNALAGFEPGTELQLFEEIKPSMIEQMDPSLTFHEAEIQDGDIICIQEAMDEQT